MRWSSGNGGHRYITKGKDHLYRRIVHLQHTGPDVAGLAEYNDDKQRDAVGPVPACRYTTDGISYGTNFHPTLLLGVVLAVLFQAPVAVPVARMCHSPQKG